MESHFTPKGVWWSMRQAGSNKHCAPGGAVDEPLRDRRAASYQTEMNLSRYKREASVLIAYIVLLAAVGVIAPSFFNAGNLRDLAMNNAAVLSSRVGDDACHSGR